MRKQKSYLTQKYYDLKIWFFRRKHPYSRLRLGDLLINLGLSTGLTILLFIVLDYMNALNNALFQLIGIGAILILLFFILKNFYRVFVNLRYGIRGLTNSTKLILVLFFVLLAWQAYQIHPDINTLTEDIDTNKFFNITSIQESANDITEYLSKEVFAPFEPAPESLEECEKLIFEKTNAERITYGLHELTLDPMLTTIAREHSLDMAQNNFFAHVNFKREDPTERALRHGYNIYKYLGDGWYSEGIGENIGKMPTGDVIGIGYVSNDPESIANAQIKSWMGSPGHRANILNPQYDKIGIGVAYDNNSFYYIITQDFY